MVEEADKFAKEDKEKRDAIDTKNQAGSMVYQTEKQLKELGDKVPAPVKEKVDSKLQELKDAISGGSTQSMKDAMAALNQEVLQIGQAMYNQPGAEAAGPASGAEARPTLGARPTSPGGNGLSDGDGIDADFTESN
jgi:heat shock 70kDa protein 1/2/6/8